jgi:peptidase E
VFGKRAEPSDLTLFDRRVEDVAGLLLSQDVIYVGGGNTASMLAVWRAHGVDQVLREAWERGIVLCGMSAGANCWFECSTTDSFGPTLAALDDGLGFLRGSFCPHYDGEPQRRPAYELLISKGFPAGYAADDNAALHFSGTELVECVSSRAEASAYRVELVDGEVVQTALETRLLG